MPRIAYVNGRYVPHDTAAVHIEDRGFQFSDSIYEVIAIHGGRLADATGHFDRLERSLREIRMDMPMSRKVFVLKIEHLLRLNKMRNANLYIQVTRGSAPRDFKMPAAYEQGVVMTLRPVSFVAEERRKIAKTAITIPDIRWHRRDIKTTQLLAQSLAKQQALDAGADEAFMVDAAGFVTEASASNAWIVTKKGELITRKADGSILKGVTRSALQQLCKKEKIRLIERAFSVTEVYQAHEVFTSAAVSMITPIVKLDGRVIGNGKAGPLTLRIMDIYMNYALDAARPHFAWKA